MSTGSGVCHCSRTARAQSVPRPEDPRGLAPRTRYPAEAYTWNSSKNAEVYCDVGTTVDGQQDRPRALALGPHGPDVDLGPVAVEGEALDGAQPAVLPQRGVQRGQGAATTGPDPDQLAGIGAGAEDGQQVPAGPVDPQTGGGGHPGDDVLGVAEEIMPGAVVGEPDHPHGPAVLDAEQPAVLHPQRPRARHARHG